MRLRANSSNQGSKTRGARRRWKRAWARVKLHPPSRERCWRSGTHIKFRFKEVAVEEQIKAGFCRSSRHGSTGRHTSAIDPESTSAVRVAAVPHYTALPGLVVGTDLVARTRRRFVSIVRTAANLTVFLIPAPFRVPELCFEQIWHPRYERDPGHAWLRDLISAAVRNMPRYRA